MTQAYQMNHLKFLTTVLILTLSSIGSILISTQKVAAQVVITLNGSVEWKPQGGRFNQVFQNMTLRQGSLLRLRQGANVTIACPDGYLRTWTTYGTSGLSQICPPPRLRSGRVITPRSGIQDIPYAILPRATTILSSQPILRWNSITDANNFTLIVRGQGLNWTERVERVDVCTGQICEFTFPGESQLEIDTAYRLVIEADNGRSSAEETTGGLGFKLLNTPEATEVNQIIERIEAQDLSLVSKALTLANLYQSYNLISDAIQTLERVSQEEKAVEIYRQLGGLYHQIGLPLEAEFHYLRAIMLAKADNNINILELSAAQFGLGEVNYALGRNNDAVRLFHDAKRGYARLGDIQQVDQIEARLEILNP